jgi:hypothetical protein
MCSVFFRFYPFALHYSESMVHPHKADASPFTETGMYSLFFHLLLRYVSSQASI